MRRVLSFSPMIRNDLSARLVRATALENLGIVKTAHDSAMCIPELKLVPLADLVHRVHHVIERGKEFHSIDHIFESLTYQRMTHV